MPDILHAVGIKSPPAAVYSAVSELTGLAGWWTTDTQGDPGVGGVIEFRFGQRNRIEMKVLELEPQKRALWQVVDGPKAWIGTKIGFDLKPDGDATTVLFKHAGWKEPAEFMHHCSTKWATFLLSMKALVETGKGAPYPNDVHISADAD